MGDFMDKTVVVTGGAHGIGKCIVDEFKKQGATPVLMRSSRKCK
ncbi:MAG: SDR family NAD(P)-dependent oxidoreductase [Eubacterium sp.]|nr:SDR family NAD(P)-dependent oxidoreductase [Eubacterium sp.]